MTETARPTPATQNLNCESAPRERGGPFAQVEVDALLAGRKTQARWPMKVQPTSHAVVHDIDAEIGAMSRRSTSATRPVWAVWPKEDPEHPGQWKDAGLRCPYGRPGDRLWVRESFTLLDWPDEDAEGPLWLVGYGDAEQRVCGPSPEGYNPILHDNWRPSIHMPRWACRLVLEITDIRVEPVLSISDADTQAEGCTACVCTHPNPALPTACEDCMNTGWIDGITPRDEFRELWDSINGARGYGWDANPWVWAITFRMLPIVADLRDH